MDEEEAQSGRRQHRQDLLPDPPGTRWRPDVGDVGRHSWNQLTTFALQTPLQVGWDKEILGKERPE